MNSRPNELDIRIIRIIGNGQGFIPEKSEPLWNSTKDFGPVTVPSISGNDFL